MKKHLSVWMLLARSSFCPLLGVCLGTAAAQAGLFRLAMTGEAYLQTPAPEIALMQGRVGLAGLLGLCLTALIALRCGYLTLPRTGYTIRRLRIGEKAFCRWHALHAAVCFLLYWASQAAALCTLCALWVRQYDPAGVQTVFLAVWRTPYLYNLLPLFNWVCWLRNLLLTAALGCAAADGARRARSGGRGLWLPVLLFLAAAATAEELFYPVCLCLLCIWALAATLNNMTKGDAADEKA